MEDNNFLKNNMSEDINRMLQYSWRINIGNRVTVDGGLDTVELPPEYHMEDKII